MNADHIRKSHDAFMGEERVGPRKRVAALLREAAHVTDPDTLDVLWREMGRIIRAEVPLTVLHPLVWNWVVNDRVGGLESRRRDDPLWYIEDVWIEE